MPGPNVNAVWRSPLPNSVKHGVIGRLAALANDDGSYQYPPTSNDLAKELRLSERAVRYQLRLADALGVRIVLEAPHGRKPAVIRFNRAALADADRVAAIVKLWQTALPLGGQVRGASVEGQVRGASSNTVEGQVEGQVADRRGASRGASSQPILIKDQDPYVDIEKTRRSAPDASPTCPPDSPVRNDDGSHRQPAQLSFGPAVAPVVTRPPAPDPEVTRRVMAEMRAAVRR